MKSQFLNILRRAKYRELKITTSLDIFSCFKKIESNFETCFLLESLGKNASKPDNFYIGFEPLTTIRANGKTVYVGDKKMVTKNPYEYIQKLFDIPHFKSKKGFCGGLVGNISYEGLRYFDSAFKLHKAGEFPDFEFGLYQDGIRYNPKTGKIVYFYLVENRIELIQKILLQKIKKARCIVSQSRKFNKKKQYLQMVKTLKKNIIKGTIFQAVPSIRFNYAIKGNSLLLYQELRAINPSPYMYFLKFGNRKIIGASPELLINVTGQTIEHGGTLAGTIRRGKNKAEDTKLARCLVTDEKEVAEHLMLVDLARNDMGKICTPGIIKVINLMRVKQFPSVQHLATKITGLLQKREDMFSALLACAPAGTVTGAPKVEAMKLINKIEKNARGPYGGVVGFFSFNQHALFAITIRSLCINKNFGYLSVGSGVVYDSDPEREYAEIVEKAYSLQKVLQKYL